MQFIRASDATVLYTSLDVKLFVVVSHHKERNDCVFHGKLLDNDDLTNSER